MPFYTFIAEWNGGTYVAQTRADDHIQALHQWAQDFDYKVVPGMGAKAKEKLFKDLLEDEKDGLLPALLTGLTNVWFKGALVRGKLLCINFVQTDEN